MVKTPKKSIERFEVNESELAQLIRDCQCVDLDFGPGWVALKWDTDKEMPEAVRRLALMRGVLNENVDGGGI